MLHLPKLPGSPSRPTCASSAQVPSDVSKSVAECRCVQKHDEGAVLFPVSLRWSAAAEKNNPKRSTILQHLLTGPHQQMLQNSSALEIKEVA